MNKPRVAILMPTYEPNPVFLRQAIESVFAQTMTNWTLLIHDDLSAVNVKNLVRAYTVNPKVTFIRSKIRRGMGGNWNACLQHAQASVLQYLFQDDTWRPRYIETALDAMDANPSVGLVGVQHVYQKEQSGESFPIYDEVSKARKALVAGKHDGKQFLLDWAKKGLRPNIVGEPSFVMLRKNVLDRIKPFREDLAQALDVEMWVRILGVSDLYWVDDILGSFRVHPQGTSNKNHQSGKGLMDRLMCFDSLIRQMPAGSDKEEAKQACIAALKEMKQKYAERTASGGSTEGMNKKALLSFAFRHPGITWQGLL